MDLKKLLLRSVSGLVYVAIIVVCVLWGMTPLTIMAMIFSTLATIEFEKITHELSPRTIPTLLLDIAGCCALCFSWMIWPLAIWIAIMICRMTLELYINSDTPVQNLAKSIMTQIYIGVPMALMCLVHDLTDGRFLLLVFAMIWINDTGAFLTGSMLGRHKLFERISPKKTWEGFFGGLVFNIIAGYIFFRCWGAEYSHDMPGLWSWMLLGVIITLFSTWGDLVESLMKRSLNIKDSGNLIPGHGGILDRIDSMLFVMPVTFLYLLILGMIF